MAEPWTEENPGSVELGCMSNATSDLSAASSKYWNASTDLGTIQGTLVNWDGLAAEAWRASITSLANSLVESRDRILDGSAAITAYRTATLDISNRASTARYELESALDVYTLPEPNQFTDPTGYAEWQTAQSRAYSREQAARGEIYRIALDRYAADGDAIRALATALPERWADTVAALASVGIGSVGDLTYGTSPDALLELAQRISAGNARPGEFEALALMLGMYEHNEYVMSELFTELGGEKTVDLVDAVGDWGASNTAFAAAALALGVLVRSGLSTGSQNWTEKQGRSFVEGMFSAPTERGDSIGYLFSDVADSALGESLAVAAANAIDELERLNGGTWTQADSGGGLWLGWNEFGIEGNRVADAAGPIFSTLGHYPDASYEWLTDTTEGDDRVQYWFHDRYDNRYWVSQSDEMPVYIQSSLDGFQGVADLWFGSQQAEGGIVYPGDVGDPGVVSNPKEAAELAARIIQALNTGEMFTPENISDAATASFAGSFVVNLPVLAEFLINSDYDLDERLLADQASGYWVPVLTNEELAVFLARAGSHGSGAQVLSDGFSAYQQTLLNMALGSGNPNAIGEALERVVELQAMLEGSTHGQLIESAEAEDARREALVDGISTVVGAVPIPGVGEAVGGLAGFVMDWGQNVLIGAAVNAGSDQIADLWATQTEAAVANFKDLIEGEYSEDLRVTLTSTLYEYFSKVDPTVLVGIEAPTGDLDTWAAEVGEELQGNVATWVNSGYPENPFNDFIVNDLVQSYKLELPGWGFLVEHYAGVVHYEDVH
jgi:hypothetical protein